MRNPIPKSAPLSGVAVERSAPLCFWWGLLPLLGVLLFFFARSFEPSQILFSSDGPLGGNSAAYASIPDGYTGMWHDLNWVGNRAGSAFPSLTYLLLWILKPLGFAKFYTPITLLFLGFATWVFFRQLRFHPLVCALGAVAGGLNGGFFSYACWGLGTLPLAIAFVLLALAALVTPATTKPWLRAALAGLAVGMAVMEGFDSGAILSLYVAAFVLFQSVGGKARRVQAWVEGAWRVALVAVLAGYMATQTLEVLIATQIEGVEGMAQDQQTKSQRWDLATMWSLPKVETLRVVVPGLFGYRMDTADGGNYWGAVGQTPGRIESRHSGSGVYCGVLVVLLAGWAAYQASRGEKGGFHARDRGMVKFWLGAMVVSLVLAWGRHAPFYQFFYALPYFSTIRNPIKFMHPFSLALVVLFGYGLDLLCRVYLLRTQSTVAGLKAAFQDWWRKATEVERKWAWVSGALMGSSLLGWMLYVASRSEVESFLRKAFPDPSQTSTLPAKIASFSSGGVGWSGLFLAAGVGLVLLIMSGILSGKRAKLGGALLGLVLVVDLARANGPWVYYWNYQEKYASNPVVDVLSDRPYEHRAAVFPSSVNQALDSLQQFVHVEWLQHVFPYKNIQTLDVIQEPRATTENAAYKRALYSLGAPGLLRVWELTNTRFLLGLAGGMVDALNQQFDGGRNRFRLHTAFTLEQSAPGGPVTLRTNQTGPFALIEFTGALPRAGLFSKWEVIPAQTNALVRLGDKAFTPHDTVVLSADPGIPAISEEKPASGEVRYETYAPKKIVLKVSAPGPRILLLNDKYDPVWVATLDGGRVPILRANYFMRAIVVPAGEHTVAFTFRLPRTTLLISTSALLVGASLLGWLMVERRKLLQDTGVSTTSS